MQICLTRHLTFSDAQPRGRVCWPGGAVVRAPFGSRPQVLTFWLLDHRVVGGMQQGQLRGHSWGLAIDCLPTSTRGFSILEGCLVVPVHPV